MNLNAEEKKQIVQAYETDDLETLERLFQKAHGTCSTCKGYSYIKQWIEYWLGTGLLKRSKDVLSK
jgi:hypothetical protein